MALTKVMTYGEIKHVMGDQYSIPVTLKLMDGATVKFSKTIDVEHKTNRTINASINSQIVIKKFEKAVFVYLDLEEVKLLNDEITAALESLKSTIPTTKKE